MQTIIEKATGKVVYCTDGEFQETETLIAIPELVTEDFVEAYFNSEERTFYEGATAEQIEAYRKQFVPFEVPLWALRTVLKTQGLFQPILDAIANLPEPPRNAALDYLEYGNFVERHSQTVLMIQEITGLTEAEVDELFIAASNLKL